MGNKRKKARKIGRSEGKVLLGAAFTVLCAAAVILGVHIFLRSYIRKFDSHIIIQGVSIGTTDVSGLTKKKAKEKVETELSAYAGEKVLLTLEDGRKGEASLGDMGLSVKSLDGVIRNAIDYGKKGSAVSCYKILKKAEKNQNEKVFLVNYEVAEGPASEVLEKALTGVLNIPENARVTQSDSGVTIVNGKPGEALDVKKTIKSVNRLLGSGWDGKSVSVRADVTYVEPQVTEGDLSEITDLLGSYSTFYGSDGSGRSQNIERGTQLISGTFMKPGEEYSANAAMEPYTEENGFTEAASYEDDKVVQSMGGGICQISTTLYNAVLYAELEVTERSPHTMLVSYVQPSMDAAIADDVKDLKFRNNQKTPIYIEGVFADGSLTFNIYGKETRDAGRTLDFVSETTDETMPEGKRFVATEDYIGSYYVLSYAEPGISAQLWKVVYLNGEEQSRDIINYSQYVPSKETVAVGTASENQEYADKVNNAVQTQDEARIMKAIQEVTGAAEPE